VADRPIDVFFYGLFMDAGALRAKGLHPVNPRLACVHGFALRIGNRATLAPCAGASAYGYVMGLTHAEIEGLYSDASVRAYRAEAVQAALPDGSTVPALCFNLVIAPDDGEANAEYAEKLRDLGRRLNLPASYVDGIR
jgi:hypothetical protein